jgi:hypothetical protein
MCDGYLAYETELQEMVMRGPNEVDLFFKTLTHPLKAEMERRARSSWRLARY